VGSAIVAVVLSALAFDYYFTEPRYSFVVAASDLPYYGAFLLFALMLTGFSVVRRRTERELLESRERLRMEVAERKTVLQQIRSDDALKMIPVVVLTSSREERDLVASYRLGVNAYVVKPVDFHEFVNAVKEFGIFWGLINEPPPGSVRRTDRRV
jgi:K+-sensing histidine kinase KdpD